MLKCKICGYTTISQISLSKHTGFVHKLKFFDYLIQTKYKGVAPICQCGCGQKTHYEPGRADFHKFIRGHNSKQEGHWGDPKNPKRVQAIIKTRKAKFASGEYDHILKQVSKPRSEATKIKISKSVTGIPKPKPPGFGVGRVQSKETRDKMSKTAKQKWETGNIGKRKYKPSKLEKTFANILTLLEINHIHSYYMKSICKIYDFYLPDYNTLIEVDGDFWHCNPDSKHSEAKYKSQKKNLINDKVKNKWAVDNGYKLLRFWEADIHNNIKQVKKTLLENCK